jgi:DNA-binding NarL/FixJ family response regulator
VLVEGPGGRIAVLVVEDHTMVAQGLLALLDGEDGIEAVGHASTLATAYDAVRELEPDVVLMDFRLPDGDGVSAARRIRDEHEDVQVVMLTGAGDDSVLAAAVDAGCAGFVTKDGRVDEVVRAIRAAAAGEVSIPSERLGALLANLSRRRHPPSGLSTRELEVLQLLATGASTSEIVDLLVLSPHTVRNHVRNILAKLGAHSKLEAVAIAAREGIVSLHQPEGG